MDPRLRIVARLPLTELWNDDGTVQAECVGTIDKAEVENPLQSGAKLVIADVGHSLLWMDHKTALAFWKSEAESRIAPRAKKFRLEDPGCYCYVPKKWTLAKGETVIVLEKHH